MNKPDALPRLTRAFPSPNRGHIDIDGFAFRILEAKRINDDEKVNAIWTDAVHTFPKDGRVWSAIARIFKNHQDMDLSIQARRQAHLTRPRNLNFALAYAADLKFKNPQAAQEILCGQLADQRNVRSGPLFCCLGKTYALSGNLDLAVTCLRYATELRPDSAKYANTLKEYEGLGGQHKPENGNIISEHVLTVLNKRLHYSQSAPGARP